MENQNNIEKYAIKFLLYSYFSISLDKDQNTTCEDETKDIIMKIIHKAYLDATQQGAYNTKVKDDDKDKSKEAKENATNTIYSFITEILSKLESYNKAIYNECHSKLCDEILKVYGSITTNNEAIFTYGNAQKWVNMTMKYLLIIHSIFSKYRNDCHFETTYGKTIDGLIPYFHVPIDSYIIDAIWTKCDDLPFKNKERWKTEQDREKCKAKIPSNNVDGWSTWDKCTYLKIRDAFQEEDNKITNGKTPIIWEGDAWIEIAEKKKTKLKSTIKAAIRTQKQLGYQPSCFCYHFSPANSRPSSV